MPERAQPGGDSRATIQFTHSDSAFWNGPQQVILHFKDILTISFSGFPAGSTLTQCRLTSARDPLVTIGLYDEIQSNIFSFDLSSSSSLNMTELKIQCQEKLLEGEPDDVYYLTASGLVGGTNNVWKIDPQLINRAGTGESLRGCLAVLAWLTARKAKR